MSLTLDGTTGISATGNITGNNVIASGTLTAGTFSPTSLSASGNITGGNILTAGIMSSTGNGIHGNVLTAGAVSAAGNVTGNYLLGNAALVTGLSASSISSGTSNVNVVSSGGNVTVGVGGTSNISVFATTGLFVTGVASATSNVIGGNILTAGIMSSTGNVIGGNILTAGIMSSTGNGIHGNILTAGIMSSTGNGIHGNILTAGLISATSTITSAANVVGGNITTGGLVSATGNVSGANLIVTGNIVDTGALGINTTSNGNITLNAGTGFIIASSGILNGQANGTGNIGNSTGYFNTIFAKATSAQYADLAEMYSAGSHYAPGTVVVFGGSYEVEISTTSHANTVAGVVSTNPSYIMNAGQTGPHVVAVALQGRVPTRVVGQVRKGDRMVTSAIHGVAQVLDSTRYEPGSIIGKALQEHVPVYDENGTEIPGTIEVVVGRI